MFLLKKSKAYGAFEYIIITALIIVVSMIILTSAKADFKLFSGFHTVASKAESIFKINKDGSAPLPGNDNNGLDVTFYNLTENEIDFSSTLTQDLIISDISPLPNVQEAARLYERYFFNLNGIEMTEENLLNSEFRNYEDDMITYKYGFPSEVTLNLQYPEVDDSIRSMLETYLEVFSKVKRSETGEYIKIYADEYSSFFEHENSENNYYVPVIKEVRLKENSSLIVKVFDGFKKQFIVNAVSGVSENPSNKFHEFEVLFSVMDDKGNTSKNFIANINMPLSRDSVLSVKSSNSYGLPKIENVLDDTKIDDLYILNYLKSNNLKVINRDTDSVVDYSEITVHQVIKNVDDLSIRAILVQNEDEESEVGGIINIPWDGKYTCKLATDADFEGASDGNFKYIGNSLCVEIPNKIKGISLTSYKNMFNSMQGNLVRKVISNNLNIVNMEGMFQASDSSFNLLGHIPTGKIIKNNLDVSELNTRNVSNMKKMFNDVNAKSIFFGPNFETSKVTNMSYLFSSENLESLDLTNLNTSNVIDMSYMFSSSKIKDLDLSSFNTSNVTNMSDMFYYSQAITLDLSNFNTSKVTDMSYMFSRSFATFLDLSSFNTSNVTNMRDMFYDSQATTLDLSNFNTSNVTDMKWMFSRSFATFLDLSSFDTSNVTDMRWMFRKSKISSLNLSSFNFAKADVSEIFENAITTEVFVKDNSSKTILEGSSLKPEHTNIKVGP